MISARSQQEHVAHQLTVHFFFLYLRVFRTTTCNILPWESLRSPFSEIRNQNTRVGCKLANRAKKPPAKTDTEYFSADELTAGKIPEMENTQQLDSFLFSHIFCSPEFGGWSN